MKIVFFGSSDFAVLSLNALAAAGHSICAVVTQPDHKKGRHLHFEGTAVKLAAQQLGIPVYQPSCINCSSQFLKDFSADLFVVVAYGQIVSERILSIPSKFCVNAHASMLPRYRGAAPINWALINGEKKTGVSIIKMSEAMDAGDVILQKEIIIDDQDDFLSLAKKLSQLAANMLKDALEQIQTDKYKLTAQDPKAVTFARKLAKRDGLINWEHSALEIRNLIRGLKVWPGAYTYYNGMLLKIYNADIGSQDPYLKTRSQVPGEITDITKKGIGVATGENELIIEELQIEGRRVMSAADFVAGHKMSAGEILGKSID